MAEWQSAKKELDQLGVTVYAASVDTHEQATEVVTKNNLTFTMIHSLEKHHTESIGGWWGSDRHGEYCQPAEFLLDTDGKILGSLYASGPIGRMNVSEAIKMIKFTEMRKDK
ncbi:MAG: redoxin domain-containing protein [Dehalococcoidia bacterium]|nr:redoxin domain-containing protein [Dehalococcoidia bacterium]